MSPWLVLTAFSAVLNLLVFILVRGRWGRLVLPLAVASLLGSVAGNALADALNFTLLDIGNFHIVPASMVAQLAMVIVWLLAALGPTRIEIED